MMNPKRMRKRSRYFETNVISMFGSCPSKTSIKYAPGVLESPYTMSSMEKVEEKVPDEIELFMDLADVNKDKLQIIVNNIKKVIKEYNPNLKYSIDYDIDPEEPIPYLVIKLNEHLPVDEEIQFLKYIWKSMRKRGHKDFLKKVSIVVNYA
ncbi:hypothetical protein ACO3VM_02075 [Methanocaldococcus sp. 10A]